MYSLNKWILCLILISKTVCAQGKKVEIGLASNFSEPSSSTSNPYGDYFRQGIQLALKQRSVELKQKNIDIQLKEFDYGTKPIRVLDAARAAAQSGVAAVLGYNWSSHALLAAPIHQKNRLPLLTPSATADRIGTFGPYIHQGCFDNIFMGKALAKIAHKKLKAKNIVMVVATDCAYCQDLAHGFRKEFFKLTHMDPKEIMTLEAEQNFNSIIQQVKAFNPDAILLPNQELLSARVIAAFSKAGIQKPYLGGDGWGNEGSEFFKIVGDLDFQGLSVTHWHENIDSPLSKNFVHEYLSTFGKKPNDTAVLTYDSMNLLIDAILLANQSTNPAANVIGRQEIEAALGKIRSHKGVTGTFIFRKNNSPEKSLVLLKKTKKGFTPLETLDPDASFNNI